MPYTAPNGGSLKGSIFSAKIETPKGDISLAKNWELKNAGYYALFPEALTTEEVKTQDSFSIGGAWWQFKATLTDGNIKLNYGFQEDAGKSFFYILGVKVDLQYQGSTEIKY